MIRLVSASRLRYLRSTGSPTRTRITGRSVKSKRGSRRLRGHTRSVPHRPTGMTGAWVAWARRAAPQRPFSSGSKNAGPRGIVPSGASDTASPACSARMACSSGSFEPDERLTRMPPAIFDRNPMTGASNTSFLPRKRNDRPVWPRTAPTTVASK